MSQGEVLKHIQLSHVGPRADEQALADLESYVGGSICAEYKKFLLDRNGGTCKPAVHSTLLTYPLLVFLRLEDKGSGGLKITFDEVNEFRGPDRLLPIAMTSGEEFVCLEIGVATPRVILLSHGQERICAASWSSFEKSLSQPPEKARPFLEELAQQPWETVQQYIEAGGELVPPEELSLLSQAIRVNNSELVKKLIAVKAAWGDLDDAVEVAVLNNRLEFLKMSIEIGGDASLAADLACGPEREGIREYLKSVSRR